MGKEEEGRTTSVGPDGGFYNLPRGFIPPADAPILTWEASMMARMRRPRMSHWAIRSTLIRTPPLCSQSQSSICTSVSVSARPFVSWAPLTPPRVEKRLNVSGPGCRPSSTRVSAVPWRPGAKPVSIYASPLGLTFGAKASTGSFQELGRNGGNGGLVGSGSVVGRRDINIDLPVLPTLNLPPLRILTSFNSYLSTPVPAESIFSRKFGGWEGRWFDGQG